MLAKQAASDARAKKESSKPPVGAPASTRPVSNNTNSSDEAAHKMNRSVFDSL